MKLYSALWEHLPVRLAVMALVVGILAVAAPQAASAGGAKTEILHVNSANEEAVLVDYIEVAYKVGGVWIYDYAHWWTYTYHVGRTIKVDENAVEAHLAHGDFVDFQELTEDRAYFIENTEEFGWDDLYEEGDPEGGYYYRVRWIRFGSHGSLKNANAFWTTQAYGFQDNL